MVETNTSGSSQTVDSSASTRASQTPQRRSSALWRDGNTIAFLYVLYRRDDSNCCATGGGKIVRFRIEGNRVKALDQLPPHQLGTIPVGR